MYLLELISLGNGHHCKSQGNQTSLLPLKNSPQATTATCTQMYIKMDTRASELTRSVRKQEALDSGWTINSNPQTKHQLTAKPLPRI